MSHYNRFNQIIQSYGAHEAHWPNDLKEEIKIWLQNHPEAQAQLEEESRLDNLFDQYHLPNPPLQGIQSVIERINNKRPPKLRTIFLPFFPKISVLFLSLFIGITFGTYIQTQEYSLIDSTTLPYTAFALDATESEINL